MAWTTSPTANNYRNWSPEFLAVRQENARCYAAGMILQAWMDAGCPVGEFDGGVKVRKAFVAMDRTGQTAVYVPDASVDVEVTGMEDRNAVAFFNIRGKVSLVISETAEEQAARMARTPLF